MGKFWACLVPEGLLDGQVMVISRRFDRPVTEWTFRQEPLPPTKNNERKNAQTFMSLPLSSPYSGFCSFLTLQPIPHQVHSWKHLSIQALICPCLRPMQAKWWPANTPVSRKHGKVSSTSIPWFTRHRTRTNSGSCTTEIGRW